MPLYTFAVGPSQVYPQIAHYYQDAFALNLPAESHRGKLFMEVFGKAVSGIREKLSVPADYGIFFTGSATECWEMLSQAFAHEGAFHAYSGSFGEKWFEYGHGVAPQSEAFRFDADDNTFAIPAHIQGKPGLIALTLNETSNGSALPETLLPKIRQAHPNPIIAVDTTSIMAGIDLSWREADIWFASVQKCFGMPAGLAVMIVSPRAQEMAQMLERPFYNSITTHLKFAEINQTPFTPNMLGIYALSRLMADVPPIGKVQARLKARSAELYSWLDAQPHLRPLVQRVENRSPTVIAVQVTADALTRYQEAARAGGYELGRGYGTWRETTFRLANFPAVEDGPLEDIRRLLEQV